MNTEEHLDRHLNTYTEEGRKGSSNGVSHVQRVCGIGYNQACHMIKRGIEKGILIRDEQNKWLHKIAT